MRPRHIARKAHDALQDTPIVFVQGPRQAGKTTLTEYLRGEGYDASYVTLDDTATFKAALDDPARE